MASCYLTVLGSAETVRWVLREERMAFSAFTGKGVASRICHGDRIFFYASSKCWSGLSGAGPGPGLVICEAVVLTDLKPFPGKIMIGGRGFFYSCELLFERLAPIGAGVSLRVIADRLEFLVGKSNYGQALQRTPIMLSANDAAILSSALNNAAVSFDAAIGDYIPSNAK